MNPRRNTKKERRRRPKWLARVERFGGRLGVAIVVAAMLLWGSAHELSALVLAAISGIGALVVVASRAFTGRGLLVGWPAVALAALAGFVALQLVPLPPSTLKLLSPAAYELYLSAHAPLGMFPAWRPLSLDPPATLFEVARLLGLAGLFILLDHRARSSEDGRDGALSTPAFVVAALAVLALSLHALGQTSLFGLWSTAGTSTLFVSPFRNDNHFAGALVVATLVLLGGAASTSSDEPWRRRLYASAALACALVVFLGTSVGAFVALGLGLVVFAGLAATRRQVAWPFAGAIVVAGVVAFAVFPTDGVWASSNPSARSGKLAPMALAVDIGGDYPVFGAGRGAFRTLHDRYLTQPVPVTFTHVENEPLQAVAELGWPVGLLAVAGVVFAVLALLEHGRSSLVEAGAAAAAFALVLHNLVDFNLQYAGASLLVGLLASGQARPLMGKRPALLVASAAVVATGVAFFVSLPALPEEEARLERLVRDARVSDARVEDAARALLTRRPANYVPAQAVVARLLASEASTFQPRWLQALLALAPTNGHAHLLAAEALAQAGAGSQALVEFRRAARLNVPSMDRVLAWYPRLDAVLDASPSEPVQVVAAAEMLLAAGRADWALEVVLSSEAAPHRRLDALRAELLLRAGRFDEALDVGRALRKRAPDWNMAWRAESLALRALGRVDEAGDVLQTGLGRLAGDYMLGVLWANHHLDAGRWGEALAALSSIDAGDSPTTRAEVARLGSVVYERMGKPALALGEMRTVLRLAPERDDARIRLAKLCLSAGLYDEAARVLVLAEPTPEVEALTDEIARRRRPKTPTAAELEALLDGDVGRPLE